MKLATIRTASGTRAVRVDGDDLVDVGAADLGAFLALPDWKASAAAATFVVGSTAEADYAPLVPQPSKIVCVGLNYRSHIEEMGREIPKYPVLFAKFTESLIGAHDDIMKPSESDQVDWECELTVVIGTRVRRASEQEASDAIAGFTVLNDISMRDYQSRTMEFLQGKTWEASTPVGPWMVTPDELPGGTRPTVDTELTVDGVVKQQANTSDLVFDPVTLVQYISTIITLNPGDLIATGTNGGVGHARKPPEYLHGGETVVVSIDGVGTLRNKVVAEP